jgi:hypothetical protein
MSQISAIVTPGYVYVPDANERILVTAARENLIGTPTVVVQLTGQIQTEDIQDAQVTSGKLAPGAVALAKLGNDSAAFMKKLLLTPTNDSDGSGKMTIRVQDANGTSLAKYCNVSLWISGSINGAPASIATFAPTTGTTIFTHTANAYLTVQTDLNGVIVMDINPGVGGTWYVMAEIGGEVFTGRAIITTS